MKEKVAVVKDYIREPFRGREFIPAAEADKYLNEKDLCQDADFLDRDFVEGNMAFVQFVAYTIVLNPEKGKIYVAKRVKGEKRLADKYSIGFGGHINDSDFDMLNRVDAPTPFYAGALRELEEELNIRKQSYSLKHIGFVRDLASNTSDHIGSVYMLPAGAVSLREKDTFSEAKWATLDEFKEKYYLKLESWSRYIFDYIYEHPEFRKELGFKEEGVK